MTTDFSLTIVAQKLKAAARCALLCAASGAGIVLCTHPAFAQDFTLQGIANFDGANGASPDGLTVFNGNLYGTAYSGGAHGDGDIYQVNTQTGAIADLADFAGGSGAASNGAGPNGSMTDYNGALYGVAYYGGANGQGDVYKVNLGTGTIADQGDFSATPGSTNLTVYNGSLYGTAEAGATSADGYIFKVGGSGGLTGVASFSGTNGSVQYPASGLQNINGNLYGLANAGGADRVGDVYTFNPNNSTISDVADFTGTNGANPVPGLTELNGAYYGIGYNGGLNNGGDVFKFDPATNSITDIANYSGILTTIAPNYVSSLVAYDGLLFGVAHGGGVNSDGDVYSVNPTTGAFTDVADFDGQDGVPQADFNSLTIFDGNLYGVADGGGKNGDGDIFEVVPTPEASSIVTFGLMLFGSGMLPFIRRARNSVRGA